MKIEKGCGKNVDIPQDDYGMWISDQMKREGYDPRAKFSDNGKDKTCENVDTFTAVALTKN